MVSPHFWFGRHFQMLGGPRSLFGEEPESTGVERSVGASEPEFRPLSDRTRELVLHVKASSVRRPSKQDHKHL